MKKEIVKLIFLLAVFLFVPSFASAYGAPDYLPDGPHPRIFLTPTTLSALRAEKVAASTRWTTLESWCDAHLGDVGYADPGGRVSKWNGNNTFNGYRMSGFRTYLLNYALAYQVIKGTNPTKAQAYATYARTILIDGIAGAFNVGEEVNGLFAIRGGESGETHRTNNAAEAAALTPRGGVTETSYKMGYAGRNLDAVAVAYDWLYDDLSVGDRAAIRSIMFRWYDWMRGVRSIYNNGVLISGIRYYEDTDISAPAPYNTCTGSNNCTTESDATKRKAYAWGNPSHNFYGGEFQLATLAAIATYGDDSYAATLHSYNKNTLIPALMNAYANPLLDKGGEAMEGWSYGGGHWFKLQALYGYYTATQENIFSSSSWPLDLLKSNIHRLYPNMTNIPVWGDNGINTGTNLASYTQTFVGINKELNPTAEETKVGQWLLENSPFANGTELAEDLLWNRPTVTAKAPSASSLLLYNHAEGNGVVSMRSSWNNASDTVMGMIILESKLSADHENNDDGQFYIIRGSDLLLDRETYTDSSLASNTIIFNNQDIASNNPPLTIPAIDKIENTFAYTYVSGDITNSYKRLFQEDRAKLFRRNFLYIRPSFFVIHDVTQSNPIIGNLKEWYTQYSADPTVSGDTISVTKGLSKAFIKTLYPLSGSYTETNYVNLSQNRWRIKFTPAVTQEFDQFLHVIEAASSVSSQTPTTLITGTGGRGTLIEDPSENIVAMFTSDQNGANMTNLSYSVSTSVQSKHIIADLNPNQNYNVSIDSQPPTQYIASSAGIIEFANADISSHTYTITSGPADTTSPNSPSGLAVM